MITRRDYEAVATAIRIAKPREHDSAEAWEVWHRVVHELDASFKFSAGANHRYNAARFKLACGVEDDSPKAG